jgi:hypothetical protein
MLRVSLRARKLTVLIIVLTLVGRMMAGFLGEQSHCTCRRLGGEQRQGTTQSTTAVPSHCMPQGKIQPRKH